MSAASEPDNAPGVDKGAAGLGLFVGTILAYFISRIPETDPLKPYLVTLAPGFAIGIASAWAAIKAGMLRRYQEENEEADVQRSLREIQQLLAAPDLTGRHDRLIAQLAALELKQEAIIARRGGIEPPMPPTSPAP